MPHCGGDNLASTLAVGRWRIACVDCGYGRNVWYLSAQLALDYWNDETRRAALAKITDEARTR